MRFLEPSKGCMMNIIAYKRDEISVNTHFCLKSPFRCSTLAQIWSWAFEVYFEDFNYFKDFEDAFIEWFYILEEIPDVL